MSSEIILWYSKIFKSSRSQKISRIRVSSRSRHPGRTLHLPCFPLRPSWHIQQPRINICEDLKRQRKDWFWTFFSKKLVFPSRLIVSMKSKGFVTWNYHQLSISRKLHEKKLWWISGYFSLIFNIVGFWIIECWQKRLPKIQDFEWN